MKGESKSLENEVHLRHDERGRGGSTWLHGGGKKLLNGVTVFCAKEPDPLCPLQTVAQKLPTDCRTAGKQAAE